MDKISEIMNKAQKYESEMCAQRNIHEKPQYHVSTPTGWINDPNGFSVYENEYHLFFQYHPYSNVWGPMHWGHMKTLDFVHWEHLPVALAPDQQYDKEGCFSGTALQDGKKHIIAYTSVQNIEIQGKQVIRQTQSIAVGDGITYKKMEQNPVIDGSMLPTGGSREDFRDPKIWKENDTFYIIVANRKEDGTGQLLKYSSGDLKKWCFDGVFYANDEKLGKMWECPDYFTLQDRQVLFVSPQDMLAQDLKYHCGNNSIYLIAEQNASKQKEFRSEHMECIDYGIDFYAPQTVLAKDGRRIMIAWMQSWDVGSYPQEFEWRGIMTFPRELTLERGRIVQWPVREIESSWQNEVIYKNVTIKDTVSFKGISGRVVDLSFSFHKMECKLLEIRVAGNNSHFVSVQYDREKGQIVFNRMYTQCIRDVVNERKVTTEKMAETISFRILMDLYSIEIFINQGENVLSSLFFQDMDAADIEFIALEGSCKADLVKRDIVM